jgi:hypothetical protein
LGGGVVGIGFDGSGDLFVKKTTKLGGYVGVKAPRSFILMITKHVLFNICF